MKQIQKFKERIKPYVKHRRIKRHTHTHRREIDGKWKKKIYKIMLSSCIHTLQKGNQSINVITASNRLCLRFEKRMFGAIFNPVVFFFGFVFVPKQFLLTISVNLTKHIFEHFFYRFFVS